MSECEPRECGSNDEGRCGGLDRRDFLRTAGLGMAVSLGVPHALWAAFQEDGKLDIKHRVPVDKKLRGCVAEGAGGAWGSALPGWAMSSRPWACPWGALPPARSISSAMGGWVAGRSSTGRTFRASAGRTTAAANPRRPWSRALPWWSTRNGRSQVRRLDRTGFPGVRFEGEYPIGRVTYRDPAFSVAVQLEAFSPFIPLDVRNSSLPATLLRFRLENRSEETAQVDVLGWLGERGVWAVGQRGADRSPDPSRAG